MSPATVDVFTARVDATTACGRIHRSYSYDARNPVFPGWRACAASSEQDPGGECEYTDSSDQENRENPPHHNPHKTHFNFLMNIKPGSVLPYNEIKCTIGLTKPLRDACRSRYTEGSLVRQLDAAGIGRPSTFAAILHKLHKRRYVVKRDTIRNLVPNCCGTNYTVSANGTIAALHANRPPSSSAADPFHATAFPLGIERHKLQLTDLGRAVIETLARTPACDALFAYDYTKKMELALDAVALGQRDWRDVCNQCVQQLFSHPTPTPTPSPSPHPTPTPTPGVLRCINKYTSVREGKYGAYVFHQPPKVKKPKFVSLKGFPHNALQCDCAVLLEWVDEHP
jgi:DNA topoisomerase IA